MVDKAQPKDTSIHVSTSGVVPKVPRNDGRDGERGKEDEVNIPLVLPANDRVLAEVANVGNTRLSAGLHQHPADVGVEETLMGVVRVEVGVGVTMVCTVATRPPLDRTLDGTCSS